MNNEHNENEKNIEKNTIQNWWKNVGLKPNLRAVILVNKK